MRKKASILKFLSSLFTIAIIISTFSGMTLTVFAAELDSPSITSTKATSTSVTIKWESVSGADAYRVEVYDYAMGNDCICTKTVTSTSATIKDLEYGVRYYFDIFSLDKKNGQYISSDYASKTEARTTPKDEENIIDNFRYKVSGKNATIVGYTGTKTKITIPAVIYGKNITAIGDDAFTYSELKEVTISEGIKKIGSYSFGYCSNLKKLVIPKSVEDISSSAWFLPSGEDGKWRGGTIYGASGSEAEKFAKEKGIPFKKTSGSSDSSIDDEKESSEKDGWVTKDGNKYYYVNGTAIKSKTKKIDGKIYLFGKTGKLLTDGIYTVKKNKYQVDENGVVTTNKWITMNKAHTYYYAQSTGKLKLYQLKYEKEYEHFNTDTYVYRLYINGEKATSKDMVVEDDTAYTIYRIGNGYYNMFVSKYGIEAIDPISINKENAYDIATGKITNVFMMGEKLVVDKGIITGGSMYDINNQMVYKFNSKSRVKSKSKLNTAFLIYNLYVNNNSVGGAEPGIGIYNNSNKTIKYINYTVKFKNDVGDYVACDITGDWTFRLKVTGPIKPHTQDYASWDPVMYDYAANHLVITSVTVEYMDGTTKSYSGDNIVFI